MTRYIIELMDGKGTQFTNFDYEGSLLGAKRFAKKLGREMLTGSFGDSVFIYDHSKNNDFGEMELVTLYAGKDLSTRTI
jgi:hypothetical protein